MLYDHEKMGREFDSRRLHICYFRVCALKALKIFMIVCSWILLRTTNRTWRGIVPEIIVPKSARFNEIVTISFVGHTALPTGL